MLTGIYISIIQVCTVLYRFNEGVTDIRGQSIEMVGSPKEVFMDYKLSHVPTMYVQWNPIVCFSLLLVWHP